LRQRGTDVEGAHTGEFVTRDLAGSVDGPTVRLRSAVGEEHGDPMAYTFTGTISGDAFAGTLDMGEYLGATFTATRRASGRRRA
jgi:L-seryl-tRNA(Ser) seleniumtransferase